MSDVKTNERKIEDFEFKGKTYQRDAKTKAIVITQKPNEMKTEDEVAREKEKEAEKARESKKKDADTHT